MKTVELYTYFQDGMKQQVYESRFVGWTKIFLN